MSQSSQLQLQQEIETAPPTLPPAAQYAWLFFQRLHQTRQMGSFGGFFAITYQEMLAYFTLENVTPEAYELELIRVWDRIALEHSAKKQLKKPNGK